MTPQSSHVLLTGAELGRGACLKDARIVSGWPDFKQGAAEVLCSALGHGHDLEQLRAAGRGAATSQCHLQRHRHVHTCVDTCNSRQLVLYTGGGSLHMRPGCC